MMLLLYPLHVQVHAQALVIVQCIAWLLLFLDNFRTHLEIDAVAVIHSDLIVLVFLRLCTRNLQEIGNACSDVCVIRGNNGGTRPRPLFFSTFRPGRIIIAQEGHTITGVCLAMLYHEYSPDLEPDL